jgi:hypothetical protein
VDVPEEDLTEVGNAGHAVIQEATEAGGFVFTGGPKHDDGSKPC